MKPHELPDLFAHPHEPPLVTLTLRITREANEAAAGYAKGMRTTKTHWLEMLIEDTIKYHKELQGHGKETKRALGEDMVLPGGMGADTESGPINWPDVSAFREIIDAGGAGKGGR